MTSMLKTPEESSLSRMPAPAVRALVMSENGSDLGSTKELLSLPGYSVQTCSNYVEMLLRLQHENFEFVIIFEDAMSSPEWKDTMKSVAENSRGALVLIFQRSEDCIGLPVVKTKQS